MSEKKFRSDEEWERYFDDIAEAIRQAQWKPTEPKKMTPEELEAYRHRIDHTRGQKKRVRFLVLTPFNDKWEHGEMFLEQFKEDLKEDSDEED